MTLFKAVPASLACQGSKGPPLQGQVRYVP
jgi:hypothetical protein